jgi:hypothetical protein
MRETECAHEAAATYIGVQALDCLDERAKTFADLPPEYQAHYKVIGDAITPLTSSTYLAYSLGWSLAYWAFQSERLFEIFREGWSSFDAIMARVPSPTDRMLLGAGFLKDSGSVWLATGLEAAAGAYSEAGTLPWDVHDDEQWRAQPLSAVGRLEAHLSAALWRSLRDNAPVVSACAERRPEGFDRWLLDQLNLPPEQERLIVKDDAFDANPENELALAATAALRGGMARISNSNIQRIERARTRQSLDRRRAIARVESLSPAVYFVGSAAPTAGKGWAVYAYKRDARPGLAPNESALADRFIVVEDFAIDLVSRLQFAGPPKPRNGSLFMAPANAELLPYYSNKLRPLIGDLPSGGAQSGTQIGFDYPLWYWTGDWPDLLAEPGIATAALRLEPSGTGIKESYILHLARRRDIPGYFFRLTSPLAGDAILRYEVVLKASGSVCSIPDDEMERVFGSLSGYIGIILDNWYVF